jgi:hypothetical protein
MAAPSADTAGAEIIRRGTAPGGDAAARNAVADNHAGNQNLIPRTEAGRRPPGKRGFGGAADIGTRPGTARVRFALKKTAPNHVREQSWSAEARLRFGSTLRASKSTRLAAVSRSSPSQPVASEPTRKYDSGFIPANPE